MSKPLTNSQLPKGVDDDSGRASASALQLFRKAFSRDRLAPTNWFHPSCPNCEKMAQAIRDWKYHERDTHLVPVGVFGDFKRRSHCQTCQNVVECLEYQNQQKAGGIAEHDKIEVEYGRRFKCKDNGVDLFSKDDFLYPQCLNPQWIDMQKVRQYIAHCDEGHHGVCHTITDPWLTFQTPGSLFLIDVERDCLVQGREKDRYIALSYVWGNHKDPLQTTTENLEQLHRAGAFREPGMILRLPRTIQDSMTLTKSLKQKYLWVDRFCIVQNDAKHKDSQILAMASIYANAYVTIVAAEGEDDEFGLPGLPQTGVPRRTPYRKFRFAPDVRLRNRHFGQSLEMKYDRRGWTFQEFVLSRRILQFRDGMVSWKCTRTEWAETDKPVNVDYCPSMLPLRAWPDFKNYAKLVVLYSGRQFSYPEDILDAFGAVVTAVSQSMVGGILYGLPEMFFDGALLWESTGNNERRKDAKGSAIRSLPSWSWVGWTGRVDTQVWDVGHNYERSWGRWLTFQPVTKWYKRRNSSDTAVRISSKYYETRERKFEPWEADYLKSILPRGDMFDHPVPLAISPIPPEKSDWSAVISCRTRRLQIHVGESVKWKTSLHRYISDRTGNPIGVAIFDDPDYHDSSHSQPCEWICIASGEAQLNSSFMTDFPEEILLRKRLDDLLERCRDHPYELYRFYSVMAIKWKHGIANRIGLGRVSKDFWDSAPTEEIDVNLG